MRDEMRERLASALMTFNSPTHKADAILGAAHEAEQRAVKRALGADLFLANDLRRHEEQLQHFELRRGLLDEKARMQGDRLTALERRVAELEENARVLYGAVGDLQGHVGDLMAAQDHGGTEAAERHAPLSGQPVRRQPAEKIEPPDGAASVQPSPAPADEWPSEAAKQAAWKAVTAAMVNTSGLPIGTGLQAAYAVDRPAIERAAVERFARYVEARGCFIHVRDNYRVHGAVAFAARYFAEQEAKDG